ncbi:AsmA family protein [Rhizosaccharibacter radicis]|uniref:AsmA family protein n=1 Tax=Rhizosaccharibacter radicis TaxID=2782605 RepID=A0ABT1W1I9_9PROT|nr:AsmA family protein [Acetobacteraceae bacterium KSS12]
MADTGTGATAPRRRHIGLWALGTFFVLLLALILLWRWDWFIPLVESQASAATGRQVKIRHLHVHLGRTIRVVLDDVSARGPEDKDAPLATLAHLTVWLEAWPAIRHFQIVLPLVDLDHPVIHLASTPDGRNNYGMPASKPSKSTSASSTPQIGVIRIEDGELHGVMPNLKAAFDINVATRGTPDPTQRPIDPTHGQIVAAGKGTYAGQPVKARFVGGAILSLRDQAHPYPIDLTVENGPTGVELQGTIQQPLTFGGANLKLRFAGPDMSLLYPLTGVPIPQTPPYKVVGNIDYSRQRIVFRDFAGTVGSSDLNGTISVTPGKPLAVDAALTSRRVDLNDLGGFIGAQPGSASKGTAPKQSASAESSGNVLPDKKINIPKLKAANVHLTYEGRRIEGRYVPLDDISVLLDIRDGDILLHKLNFGVGTGTLASSAHITPVGDSTRTEAHVDVRRVDLSHLLAATHAFKGKGVLGGQANIKTEGASIAQMLAHGNGGLTLVMSGGGNISALLPDIAGLEFGNALLSALGFPNRADVQCFIVDMPLRDGILDTRTLLLQTSEARSVGEGKVDFRNQTLDYSLTTRSTHFSIGSLPGPINITGKLGKPSIRPGTEVVARAGAATGLGILLAPLALLPTVQFGVGEAGACQDALSQARNRPASGGAAAAPARKGRHRH